MSFTELSHLTKANRQKNQMQEDDRHSDAQLAELNELSDADYPPVYGEPVFGRSSSNTAATSNSNSNTITDNSPFEAITQQCEPSSALVDSHQVCQILIREGFSVEEEEVSSLNIFPSPMDAFQYALYSFGITDIYIVLMVNMRQRTIYGYHILDLTQNYSLVDDLINRLQNKDFLLT